MRPRTYTQQQAAEHPRTFTLAEAAAHVQRSERTIRSWCRQGWLAPIPGSLRRLGHHLYDEPSLLRAERDARHAREKRRGVCAGRTPSAMIRINVVQSDQTALAEVSG